MTLFLTIAALLLATVTTTVLVRIFETQSGKFGLRDLPNARSAHTVSTPRGGGLVVVCVWIFSSVILTLKNNWSYQIYVPFIIGGLIVSLAGFMDDLFGIPPWIRLLLHVLASTVCVIALHFDQLRGVTEVPHSLLFLLTALVRILFLTWAINLFNFMDGTDGLAASQGIVVFATGGIFLYLTGRSDLALSSWLLAAAITGFLLRNWPPAKIFMGDVCSGFLGYMIATFALVGEKESGVSSIIWWMLLSGFLFDSTVTLARRFLNRERWYEAHKNHAYQRLYHLAGWSHLKILNWNAGINLFAIIICGLAFIQKEFLLTSALIETALLSVAYLLIERKIKQRNA